MITIVKPIYSSKANHILSIIFVLVTCGNEESKSIGVPESPLLDDVMLPLRLNCVLCFLYYTQIAHADQTRNAHIKTCKQKIGNDKLNE